MGELMVGAIDRRRVLREGWKRLSLSRKFILLGSLYTLSTMLLFGILTTTNMTQYVLQSRGDVVSAVAQHVLAPFVNKLDAHSQLDDVALVALEQLVTDPRFAAEFPFIDIWLQDGTIIYSNTLDLPTARMNLSPAVLRAFNGDATVEFTDVDSAEYAQHHFSTDFIEIYIPLHRSGSDEVLAVAQLRESTSRLERDLLLLTLTSWMMVAAVSLVLLLGLFSIVTEGSRTIDRQSRILSKRLAQAQVRAAHLRKLRAEAQQSSRSIAQLTDKHLRTIGTDLHDGPAQSIGFAVLKLDQVRHLDDAANRNDVVSEVETILGDALGEIRLIAHALVLPDIENLNLAQTINKAIQLHVQRTNLQMTVDNRAEAAHVEPEIAICVFRFIQEGLNNAFYHGLADGQAVSALTSSGVLKLAIINRYIPDIPSGQSDHLGIGLYGLRARVQSAGGNFVFVQNNGETKLEMWLRYGGQSFSDRQP